MARFLKNEQKWKFIGGMRMSFGFGPQATATVAQPVYKAFA